MPSCKGIGIFDGAAANQLERTTFLKIIGKQAWLMHQRLLPEMPRPLGIDKIPAGGMEEDIVARPTEREAVARRLGLQAITRLEARFSVQHAENKMVAVVGSVSADVVQECVVTLEPLASTVEEEIDVLFAPVRLLDEQMADGAGHVDVAHADEPEPLIDGTIDLGELAVQHLALALDPYPRHEGAAILSPHRASLESGAAVDSVRNNPFAKLKDLIKPKD